MSQPGRRSRGRLSRTNPLTTLVLVVPLLVFYQLGVLLTGALNGADFVTRMALRLLGVEGFLAAQAVLLLLLLATIFYLRRTYRFELRQLTPVFLESGIYALTMGTLIIFVMVDLLGIDPRLTVAAHPSAGPAALGLLAILVTSVGAGVYEELVFRLLIMGGILLLCQRGMGMRRWAALPIAIAVSALLFALAHHIGPYGEPLRLGAFAFRTLAGVVFSLIYHFRGIALAMYTHTFYDIYVLLLFQR